MPKPRKPAARGGYTLEKVTIRDLFQSGQTREPSEKALRARARILVFVESNGNTHYYDRQLSLIRVNAARRCKGPGVQWEDIGAGLERTSLTNARLVKLLNEGSSIEEATDLLAQDLLGQLQPRWRRLP